MNNEDKEILKGLYQEFKNMDQRNEAQRIHLIRKLGDIDGRLRL
jgi:hypothetical protein